MVFLLDKSLSLRLGRPSNLRDAEVTTPLPSNPNIRRCSQTSRIQGRIYDQLYGPVGLAGFDGERGAAAQVLAAELREIINQTRAACHVKFPFFFLSFLLFSTTFDMGTGSSFYISLIPTYLCKTEYTSTNSRFRA